jgi:hypothetical protein
MAYRLLDEKSFLHVYRTEVVEGGRRTLVEKVDERTTYPLNVEQVRGDFLITLEGLYYIRREKDSPAFKRMLTFVPSEFLCAGNKDYQAVLLLREESWDLLLFLNGYFAKKVCSLAQPPSRLFLGSQVIGMVFQSIVRIIDFDNQRLIELTLERSRLLDCRLSYYDTSLACLCVDRLLLYKNLFGVISREEILLEKNEDREDLQFYESHGAEVMAWVEHQGVYGCWRSKQEKEHNFMPFK